MNVATAQRPKAAAKPKSEANVTMSADELNSAIETCGTVYIAIQLEADGKSNFLRWKDRSFAIRRKIRALAREAQKTNPTARFRARVQEGLDRVLIVG